MRFGDFGKRGRPREPSYRAYQLIYDTLSRGPMTPEKICEILKGQINRQTVYSCLGLLLKKGLVSKDKAGTAGKPNRKLYTLIQEKPKFFNPHKPLSWGFFLKQPTRKEKREFKVTINELSKITRSIVDAFNSPDGEELRRLFPRIEKAPVDTSLVLLEMLREKKICPECLQKLQKGEGLAFSVFDPQTDKSFCTRCGLEL